MNILIVDDQAGIRYLLDTLVKEEGHNSYTGANGAEAVELVKKHRPELVFMDIKMPVMDGTQALEKIKELGFGTEVIMMTAFTEKEVVDKAYRNGAVKCLIKPFDINEVRDIIRDYSTRVAI
ncbi:MAG: response regulator [Bacillota bacterium]